MTKLKITIGVASVLSFAMLTACGDGFKATDLLSATPKPKIERNTGDLGPGNTATNVDEQAVAEFADDVAALDSSVHSIFARSIEGLSLVRTDATLNLSTTTTTMTVDMVTGCSSSQQIQVSGNVNIANLQRGETEVIANTSNFSFAVACTDSQCEEMALTILRFGMTNNNQGVVHFGLKTDGATFPNNRTSNYEYYPRPSDGANFYMPRTGTAPAYINANCSSGGGNDDVSPVFPGSGTGNDDFTSPGGIDESLWTDDGANNSDVSPIF